MNSLLKVISDNKARSYVKLFQIAQHNLSIANKESKASRPMLDYIFAG